MRPFNNITCQLYFCHKLLIKIIQKNKEKLQSLSVQFELSSLEQEFFYNIILLFATIHDLNHIPPCIEVNIVDVCLQTCKLRGVLGNNKSNLKSMKQHQDLITNYKEPYLLMAGYILISPYCSK